MAHHLPSESLFGDYSEWPGRDVLDSGGERLGDVREIYLDRETGHPEWVLVDVDDDTPRFVPLVDASIGEATIRVAHTASEIRSAPGIGADSQIDQAAERRLYAHYGLGYSEDDSGSGLPSDRAPVPRVDSREETSAAAEPNIEAPPPAEPPSPDEIESADIPEPPAATERAADFVTPTPAAAGLEAPDEPAALEPPTSLPELSAEPATTSYGTPLEPSAVDAPVAPAAEDPVISPLTPSVSPPELSTAALGPKVVPDELPGGPAEPMVPPASAAVPPPPEPSGGRLAIVKQRPVAIGLAAAGAAALFLIVRRLR